MKFEILLQNLSSVNVLSIKPFSEGLERISEVYTLKVVDYDNNDKKLILFECDSVEDFVCKQVMNLLCLLKTAAKDIAFKIHHKFQLEYVPAKEESLAHIIQLGLCSKKFKIDESGKYYLVSATSTNPDKTILLYDKISLDHRKMVEDYSN